MWSPFQKRYIANALSICNLICGLFGCHIAITSTERWALPVAFCWIFLGQFFDLFDGRAAGRWGSTPQGELLDDIADGTSFGLCVGIMIFRSLQNPELGAIAGIIHFGATIYRLVRFVVRKRRAGVTGGVAFFTGLPSPAAALVISSMCILYPRGGGEAAFWDAIKLSMTVLTSVLMVGYMTYPHGGRFLLDTAPRWLVKATVGAAAAIGVSSLVLHDMIAIGVFYHTLGVMYVVSPFFVEWRLAQEIITTIGGETSEEAIADAYDLSTEDEQIDAEEAEE